MLTKSKFLKCLGVMCLSVISVTAFAQPTPPAPAVAVKPPVPEGTATLVPVETAWFSDGTVALIQFDINYDSANLTPDLAGCGGASITPESSVITVACSNPSAGVVRIAADDSALNVIADRLLTNVNFDVSAAAVGTYPLTVTGQVYGDSNAASVTPGVPDNGSITISGPAYTSAPTPAQGVTLGPVIQNAGDPTAPVLVTNTGAVGTTLTVTGCSITNNPTVFSVDSTAQFTVAQGSPGVTRTVSCDSSQAIQVHNGEMTCNHNGGAPGESDPAVYALTCNITDGPQPVYNSTPAPGVINMTTDEEGDPVIPVVIAIDNNGGQVGSTLTGNCDLVGNSQISHTGAGFSISMGGTPSLQTIQCNSSAQGTYTATLTCPNNDKLNSAPAYDIICVIPPPGAAIFQSAPPPGTIDMTAGLDVAAGETVPDSPLIFSNGADEVDDNDLVLFCSEDGAGSPEITFSPNPLDVSIAPLGASPVAVSCDATNAGSFSKTFNCDYTTDGSGLPAGDNGLGSASYTYTCEVREAESVVVPEPDSGTPLTATAEPGGSAQLSVFFRETADEDVNGSVDCSLADGSDFVIDTALPADVPAGGLLTVTVTGTDPGTDVDSISDTLNCTYTDSANTDPGVDVSYPLLIEFGGAAGFVVTKAFTDGNDEDVTVTLTCNTGLPLQQSHDISPGDSVRFIVISFESGTMDCVVTEGDADGYLTAYVAGGDSLNVDDNLDAPGCHFFGVAGGDENACSVTNVPAPVDVVINKLWFVTDSVGDELIQFADLTLFCDSPIVDGKHEYGEPLKDSQLSMNGGNWYKDFDGVGDQTYIAQVIPKRPSTSCWVVEGDQGSTVEVENGCMNIVVSVGNGDTCTITNTVFFEGIPTLSQYGLALMALLMLGVGMVGFRRFA